MKRIHPSFIGKRTDRVDSSPVIPQLTLPDGSPFPLPSLLDFDPEYVKLKMTSNANRFQENYEIMFQPRSHQKSNHSEGHKKRSAIVYRLAWTGPNAD